MAIELQQTRINGKSTNEVAVHPNILLGLHSTEIVLGLHWDPPIARADSPPVDLDAICVLYGPSGEVSEIIHPGNPRSSNGSIVHTGDSRTGSSAWDDERIFVFLGALPAGIAKLAFIVVSASRHAFDEVCGAVCHVSDRTSEAEWLRTDLTSLSGRTTCTVATLHRDAAGWRIVSDAQSSADRLPAEVRRPLERNKHDHDPVRSRGRSGSFGRRP